MLVVGLAPLLSCADAVDGAPAGALKAGNSGAHRRALIDNPDSPWHRRYADSRRQATADPLNPDPNVDGEPFFFKYFHVYSFSLHSALLESKRIRPQRPLGPCVHGTCRTDLRSVRKR
jgi:hypothetical protein